VICSFDCSLQELHLHNNHLSSLPDELMLLRRLYVLVLAFNRFVKLPTVLTRMTKLNVSEIENVIFAGNQVFARVMRHNMRAPFLRHTVRVLPLSPDHDLDLVNRYRLYIDNSVSSSRYPGIA